MAVYLVNQGKTYKHEKDGGYIWSPKLNRAGKQNSGYSLMMEVRKGDFIIHNSGGKLSAISVVQEDCKSGSQPIELRNGQNEYDWDDDGWLVNTEYYEFTSPIINSDLVAWAAQNYKKNSAFQKNGKMRLQYLCNLEKPHAEYILQKALGFEKKPEVIEVLQAALKDDQVKSTVSLRLEKITLENIRNFKKIHEFDFSEANYINTISGINGSGKSTVFECVSICQKAYFVYKYFPSGEISKLGIKYNSILSKDIANIVSEWRASIELALSLEDNRNHEDADDAEKRVLRIKLKTRGKTWELSVTHEDDAVLEKYWNPYNPTNIIVLLDADKMVDEEDFTFQKINMMSESKGDVIDFIMDPKKTYQNLYNNAMNSYIYNRLVPSGKNNRKDQFTVDSKTMFSEIMESHNISIGNFSGQQKQDQFVLTASKNGQYDMRQMSSGEKLIWYILLLLNYIKSISVLIIDEPENHLHEQLSWSLVNYLIKTNEEHKNGVGIGQVFLLTHAKNLIYNNFSEGVNYLLDDSNSLSRIDREQCEDILRSCGISYIDDKVLYVEGQTEINLLNSFCTEDNIKIRQLSNCDEIIRVYKGLSAVRELVYVPKFVLLLDRDTRDEDEIQSLMDEDPDFFSKHFTVLPCHEIENLFLDETIIAEQYNKLMHAVDPDFNADISADDVLAIIRRKADDALENTKKKYLNYKLDRITQGFKSLINLKGIKSDSKAVFDTYIDDLFSSVDFTDKIKKLKETYDEMSEKYSESNWNTQWKQLCDGKTVYNQTITELSQHRQFSRASFEKNVLAEIRKDKNSILNNWWRSIEAMFN